MTPGSRYVYERVGREIYARELGADPQSRRLIGWDSAPAQRGAEWSWSAVEQAALEHPAVADALDHLREVYALTRRT